MTDIAVIGGGPAGLTAALYAARAGRNVTVFEKECIGGQITRAQQVENYPGTGTVSGLQIGDSMAAQAEKAGAGISLSEVLRIKKEPTGYFCLETDDGESYAKAVIYACGARPRMLGLPGEEKLVGKGISYCALCDSSFFRGQDVAVVGGGNSAFDDALILSKSCRKVTLIHRGSAFRAEHVQVNKAEKQANITFMTDTIITELIEEGGQFNGLTVENAVVGKRTVAISGLFVALGRLPDTEMLIELTEQNDDGYVYTDDRMACLKTSGLFIAGDCRAKRVRQLTTAVADGSVAAVSACEYLENFK